LQILTKKSSFTGANQFVGSKFDEEYDVSEDGTVLLPEATLQKADLDGMQSYHLEAKANQITVREYGK